MKILLTGASGLVGSAFARTAAQGGHEVAGIVGRFAGEIEGVSWRRAADLTAEAIVAAVVAETRPDAIVNCAAISEPAACVADPVLSEKMNVALPGWLARLARGKGARLVHVSSEQAFDGARTEPYARGDEPRPINLYGRQKVAGERAVMAAAGRAVVVRAPLLMGDSMSGKRSLHERLLGDWSAGRVARLYVDEFRQPCTAANLADAMLELMESSEIDGVVHWAGRELISRYELGVRVRERFGLSETAAPIGAVTRAEMPELTKERQACLALDLEPLGSALQTRPQTIAEQLTTLRVPAVLQAWLAAR